MGATAAVLRRNRITERGAGISGHKVFLQGPQTVPSFLAYYNVDSGFVNQRRAPSAMTHPPPTLMTLPVEIRTHIFYLALLDTPVIRDPDPPYRSSLDLSLLSTSRQVYSETRTIPIALQYFGSHYNPKVNFFSTLRLRTFQIASLKTLGFDLSPSDLTHFLALGSDNGFLFGEQVLDLDLLIIYADDWIADASRRWRYVTSPGDVHHGLPKSSRWLRALCGLKGWKQLEVVFKARELVTEYWKRGRFMQSLFDDFRSQSGNLDEDFTIWHESHDTPYERITVLRTRELGRFKQPQWWRGDLGRLVDGRDCVFGESIDTNDDEEGGVAFHVQERCWCPTRRQNHCTRCCTRCQPDCGGYQAQH